MIPFACLLYYQALFEFSSFCFEFYISVFLYDYIAAIQHYLLFSEFSEALYLLLTSIDQMIRGIHCTAQTHGGGIFQHCGGVGVYLLWTDGVFPGTFRGKNGRLVRMSGWGRSTARF